MVAQRNKSALQRPEVLKTVRYFKVGSSNLPLLMKKVENSINTPVAANETTFF
jgi:hypothetical protein